MNTTTAPSYLSSLALFIATKASLKQNMALQNDRIVAEFPEFNDLTVDYTDADRARMDELCADLYPQASELNKLEGETLELAYNEICNYFVKEAPDSNMRNTMKRVLATIEAYPHLLPHHRVVAWAITGFKGGVPSTTDALMILASQ